MLLLVGVSVRALMESAAASGYKVIGIDIFGDVDALWHGKAMRLKDLGQGQTVKNLLEAAKKIPCSGLVYSSGPENTPDELEFWEKCGLLYGNEGSVLRKVRNPRELKRCVEKNGLRMPPFFSVDEWNESVKKGRWLLKALNRGSCHGIVELPAKLKGVPDYLLGLNRFSPHIVQKYVEGISASATFLANGQEALVVGTSRQLINRDGGDGLFYYKGNIVPLDVGEILNFELFITKINELARCLTLCFGLKGINTVDFILNSEGIWVLEVNPRWSASVELIEKYLGKSLFNDHLKVCKGGRVPGFSKIASANESRPCQALNVNKDRKKYIGKMLVIAERTLVTGTMKDESLRYLYEQGIRDIPRSAITIEEGQPICTVLARGITERDCLGRLKEKSQIVSRFCNQYYSRGLQKQKEENIDG